ncbi:MAG: 16S rRNA (guanine(966)-N(2))-methyltransferase RsmD [Gammaproteobacteria bacterium]|jgi:16S rRNA (guanine966-N2)-methyltransferase
MPRSTQHSRNAVRIIGGQWRNRKLRFSDIPELRPTPDRVRETVFNWLQDVIMDARCLDLFAGSGAMGFEALSRGADHCLFIDNHPQSIEGIQNNLHQLKTEAGETMLGDTLQILKRLHESPADKQFNVAFVDPPYAMDCALHCCQLLVDHEWLAEQAYIYIESATPVSEDQLPDKWHLHRQKKAGHVHYHLAIQQKS